MYNSRSTTLPKAKLKFDTIFTLSLYTMVKADVRFWTTDRENGTKINET